MATNQSAMHSIWLHRYAKLVVAATFVLIFVGGLVTSTGSGLAVPDWPSTYGQFMFSYPWSKMVGGILYEHGHRMVASVVGFMTIILAVWLWLKEPRRWLKWLGIGALLAVIAQGILGGLTVLYRLPTPISVMHGCLAQIFFCMTIAIAMFTSNKWKNAGGSEQKDPQPSNLPYLALITTVVVFVQLILGAIMRHTGSGLAIPDFPLAFGKIIPPISSQAVAIHFLHRLGAFFVSICVMVTVVYTIRYHRHNQALTKPALTLAAALVVQIVLAAFTIWTQKAVLPTTAHVAVGAFILGNSLFLFLLTYRLIEPGARIAHRDVFIEQPTLS